MKLNLGSGSLKLKDYINYDIKDGKLAYPLDVPDESCDEIRASHILEHYSHRQVFQVITDWVSKLKIGGILKIAVPDFAKIVEHYRNNDEPKMAYYLMGGQVDADDFHKSIFDEKTMIEIFEAAGLSDIRRWESDVEDCASLPISLNLVGKKTESAQKRIQVTRKVSAVMTMPRLCFTDNMTCLMKHLVARGIPFKRSSGVFWGQCLTRMLEEEQKQDSDFILTIDYDSWFTFDDIHRLMQILELHPEYDAVFPVQNKREDGNPLVGVKLPNGEDLVPMSYFKGKDIVPAETGHFGLTLFRRSCFEKIPKPWFIPKPDKNLGWNEGRQDEDIVFWHNFREGGCKVGIAPEVKIGHLELLVTYPGDIDTAWKPTYKKVSDLEKL